MKITLIKLAVLLAVVSISAQLYSCDKLKNIKGSIAGQVMDENGVPMGFTSVAVLDENGSELTRQTTNNEGGYFISELSAGTYSLEVWVMGTEKREITSGNATGIKLGIGKTETIDLTVKLPEKGK
ncbi:carboxypeptidase regulatory-like domain-containing protein [bacterium]|nr:carboxypeptidase regulatory-like domain-containing protein [bacterium]